jgi:hypothetical protein
MKKYTFFVCIAILSIFFFKKIYDISKPTHLVLDAMSIQDRNEYMHMLLADPATGQIPKGIRSAELEFARTLPKRQSTSENPDAKIQATNNWFSAGPVNLGGRTRAIGIDISNDQILLAGGVSSGMFKSTNQGLSWRKTFTNKQLQSVTCLAQDIRPGKTRTWYCGSGEFYGNSASLNGDGLFSTTDNGDSWQQLAITATNTPQTWESPYEYIYNISIDPSNLNQDEVYVSTALGGIYRTTDGGKSFKASLGGSGNNYSLFTDVKVSPKGIVYACMSTIAGGGGISSSKGIWRSIDGINWVNITPANFPVQTYRMIIEINPLDENQVLFFGHTPNSGKKTVNFRGDIEWNSLWKYTFVSGDGKSNGGIWENRSENLPALGGEFGDLIVQQGYDLVVKYHPTDTNIVFIGGTNLYRSTNGFRNPESISWIGGYKPYTKRPYFEIYPNHHPDQHALIFFPNNPNKALSANDGGIQKTDNCVLDSINWTSCNYSYLTSQFYTIAIDHATKQNPVIIGGLQDNGTYMTTGSFPSDFWEMKLTYDGAFCAIEDNRKSYYMSAQQGRIARMIIDDQGTIISKGRIDPAGGTNYLFINPFTLDKTNQNIMYVAGGQILWRNNNLKDLPMGGWDSTSIYWDSLSNTRLPTGESISAVSSTKTTNHILYFGTNKGNLYKIIDADKGDPIPIDITGGKFPINANIQNIAIDPRDANKALVVFSNYNVLSMFYTSNGGESWTPVSGNLEENQSGGGKGPSCRWAQILPVNNGTMFYVGTSVGLFSTSILDSTNTCWEQEGSNTIGNSVVVMLDAREQEGYVVAATHGSGVYASIIFDLPLKANSPELISPGIDSTTTSTTITYRWTSVPNAVFYKLDVSETPDFSTLKLSRSLITNTFYTASTGIVVGKSYYWRVQAINSAGASVAPNSRKFSVKSSTGINEEQDAPIVYISNGILVIKKNDYIDNPEQITYSIYDIVGNCFWTSYMLKTSDAYIDISSYPKGIYIVVSQTGNKTWQTKLLNQ